MERVVRSTKVPTADLQSLAYEQVAFPVAGHGPRSPASPSRPRHGLSPVHTDSAVPSGQSKPNPSALRLGRAALVGQGPRVVRVLRDIAAQASQQVWRKYETSH